MKKRYIVETVHIALIILAIIMKLFNIVGGSILLTVSGLSLSTIYFIGGYFLFNKVRLFSKKAPEKKVSPKRAVYTIALGLSLSTIVMAIMFKLMLWQGGGTQLSFGLITVSIGMVFLVMYALVTKKGFTPYKSMLKRGIIALILGVAFLNISGTDLAKVYYRNNPEYREALINILENPNSEAARDTFNNVMQRQAEQDF